MKQRQYPKDGVSFRETNQLHYRIHFEAQVPMREHHALRVRRCPRRVQQHRQIRLVRLARGEVFGACRNHRVKASSNAGFRALQQNNLDRCVRYRFPCQSQMLGVAIDQIGSAIQEQLVHLIRVVVAVQWHRRAALRKRSKVAHHPARAVLSEYGTP